MPPASHKDLTEKMKERKNEKNKKYPASTIKTGK